MITKHASQTIKQILSTRSIHAGRGTAGGRSRTSTVLHQRFLGASKPSPLSTLSSSLSPHSRRCFHTESEYHNKADDTLQTIQDTLDFYFEDNPEFGKSSDINYASGVLTIALSPEHGTWVLNKQTPNRQIWWSSPVSGPRRYEFDDSDEKWIWSRYIDFQNSNLNSDSADEHEQEWTDTKYLGESLKKEMVDMFKVDDGLEDLDDL